MNAGFTLKYPQEEEERFAPIKERMEASLVAVVTAEAAESVNNTGGNLEYTEEYIPAGDPGMYLSTFEAAKVVFRLAKENDNIPEYSDDTRYTMVLVGLETIGDEECYLYRLDADEPTGTVGAAYAYAYQSGNIYIQGYGGQFILILNYPDFLPY